MMGSAFHYVLIPTTVREVVLRFVRSSFGGESQNFVNPSKLGCATVFTTVLDSINISFFSRFFGSNWNIFHFLVSSPIP